MNSLECGFIKRYKTQASIAINGDKYYSAIDSLRKCITYFLSQIWLGNCVGIHTILSECVLG